MVRFSRGLCELDERPVPRPGPIGFIHDIFDVIRDTRQHTYQVLTKRAHRLERIARQAPLAQNLWMGVSVESAAVIDRIDQLRRISARTKFLSCEPLLTVLPDLDLTNIDWVIAAASPGHARDRWNSGGSPISGEQCTAAGVAFFFKQWGGRTPKANGRELDGRTWDEMP